MPVMLDTFACGGGAGEGYRRAGFDVYAIDNDPKTLKVNPHPWLLADAMLSIATLLDGRTIGPFTDGRVLSLRNIAAIHGSPPCQGYSIMNNLPWIRSRTYPLLILPLRELLEQTGKPYIIENVAGAASVKNLTKLGLLDHRLRAAWLCGGMFGLPIYRHRYFETNWFWPQPGHPKHIRVIASGRNLGGRARVEDGIVVDKRPALHLPMVHGRRQADVEARQSTQMSSPVIGAWDRYKHTSPIGSAMGKAGLSNGAQASGVADGHAAGWHIAADAMGIDWMNRATLTQAIPPVMTEYIGRQLLNLMEVH